jgi:hypothetical protein
VGEIEIKAKLSPAKAGAWAELGNNAVNSGHFVSVIAHATTRTNIIFHIL